MHKLTIEEKNKYIKYVVDKLISKYNYTRKQAEKMVKESIFVDLLNDDPKTTLHYSVEYWIDVIFLNTLIESLGNFTGSFLLN